MRTPARLLFSLVVSLLFLASPLSAQEEEGYTRLLVPLTAYNVPGVNGSVWTTEWTVFNGTAEQLYVSGPFPFLSLSPMIQDNTVEAQQTKRLFLRETDRGMDGAWIYVPDASLERLSMSLRVRDISVNAQSYGTSIPLVRRHEYKPAIRLIDVPVDPSYRATLRVYSYTDEPHPVLVTVFAANRAAPLDQYEVALHRNELRGIEETPRPAYVQLDPLSEAVRASGGAVRIEVTSLGAPVWAFVSISHNQTQQVTTVLP